MALQGSGSRRWWALAALAMGSLIVNVDGSVLNLALPTLSSALHASTAQLQWFVDAYTLVMAALMLPAGLLGDRLGRKRLIALALGLFGLASLACAAAPTPAVFIAARATAGLAAAFFVPLGLAVLTVLFNDAERPKAITILAGMSIVASPIGPILGGYLLAHFWWGSVFLINVPVVAFALVVLAIVLPESRSARRPAVDGVGVLTSSASLVALVYGIIEAGQRGWGSSNTLLPLGIGVALLVGFVLWERRLGAREGGQPLVDLGLFRSASFTWGTLLATAMTFALFGLSFIGPQFFQAIRGLDPQGTGFRLLPTVGGFLVGAIVGNRLLVRVGTTWTVAFGFVLLAAGLGVGTFTHISSGDAFVLSWMALNGIGCGLVMPGTMAAALAALPTDQAGSGSALMMAVRTVGGAFGVAILGSILNAVYQSHLQLGGLPVTAARAVQQSVFGGLTVARQVHSASLLGSVQGAFTIGMDTLLVVSCGIALASALLAIAFLPRSAAEGTAATGREAEPVEEPLPVAS